MTPSKILPANEAVLRRRFPDALMKIMESGDEMPVNFTYDDSGIHPNCSWCEGSLLLPIWREKPKTLD